MGNISHNATLSTNNVLFSALVIYSHRPPSIRGFKRRKYISILLTTSELENGLSFSTFVTTYNLLTHAYSQSGFNGFCFRIFNTGCLRSKKKCLIFLLVKIITRKRQTSLTLFVFFYFSKKKLLCHLLQTKTHKQAKCVILIIRSTYVL